VGGPGGPQHILIWPTRSPVHQDPYKKTDIYYICILIYTFIDLNVKSIVLYDILFLYFELYTKLLYIILNYLLKNSNGTPHEKILATPLDYIIGHHHTMFELNSGKVLSYIKMSETSTGSNTYP
jgi:hypothetical protein